MEKQVIRERLTQLKKAMKQNHMAVYVIPMNDFHGSEYIGEYFKLIAYFSGFTGSAGTLVVTQEESFLWTDGRYFIQAEKQLADTGILLQKMGEKDVPTIPDFIRSYVETKALKGRTVESEGQTADPEGRTVGFDGRTVSNAFVKKLEGIKIVSEKDLAGDVWNADTECRRPELSKEPVWILDEAYAGKSAPEKLAGIRRDMEEQGADCLLLTTLDDIAWLTNLRGNDIAYNPVFLSYMMITKQSAVLYMDTERGGEMSSIIAYLESCKITVCAYEKFYEDVARIDDRAAVWFDETSASFCVTDAIPKTCRKIAEGNPVLLAKAVKHPVEVENIRNAHIKDGVAVTKFIYWLKTKVRTGEVSATEISAAEKLISLRRQQEHYLGESFDPIVAFGEHGAIVHYSAEEATDAVIENKSLLLIDTGGHFLEGTTDITRTVVMGHVSKEQKAHYTAVLQGNLRLADAVFKEGLCGANLDYIAREPLYRLGLDFNHGTGHGVGYVLNVHEGPNGFRMRYDKNGTFREGMVTSDEPGFYQEGSHGIRLENLIVCAAKQETEYGKFLCFEPLTLVPFDTEAIDETMLTERDKQLLTAYHRKVYDAIADRLDEAERAWLAETIS